MFAQKWHFMLSFINVKIQVRNIINMYVAENF